MALAAAVDVVPLRHIAFELALYGMIPVPGGGQLVDDPFGSEKQYQAPLIFHLLLQTTPSASSLMTDVLVLGQAPASALPPEVPPLPLVPDDPVAAPLDPDPPPLDPVDPEPVDPVDPVPAPLDPLPLPLPAPVEPVPPPVDPVPPPLDPVPLPVPPPLEPVPLPVPPVLPVPLPVEPPLPEALPVKPLFDGPLEQAQRTESPSAPAVTATLKARRARFGAEES
jgi:hypothetical protein